MSAHHLSTFGFFRQEGYPTFYSELSSKISLDVTLWRISLLFLALFISFLCIVPGFRGIRRVYVLIRWNITFAIGLAIIVCNFLPYWECGTLDIHAPYHLGSSHYINATIGVNVGLRGVNVTLKGLPLYQHDNRIDFNEEFKWTWQQGKPGFGYDAGLLHKQYRIAQHRALPYPILWVAETLTIDYERVRIGRYHRQSGWYAQMFLWLALPLFCLANILFQMVIQYGSLFMIFTGFSLLCANLVVTFLRSSVPFSLAFESIDLRHTNFLQTHYSWCYYVNLVNAVLCTAIGVVTLVADLRCPDETAEFFGNEVLQSYEDYFADPQQEKCDQGNDSADMPSKSDNEVLLRRRAGQLGDNCTAEITAVSGALKKRSLSNRFSRFQKSTIRKATPANNCAGGGAVPESGPRREVRPPRDYVEEVPLYENFQQFDPIGEEREETEENEL